jgi:hypothetical protein
MLANVQQHGAQVPLSGLHPLPPADRIRGGALNGSDSPAVRPDEDSVGFAQ